MDNLLPREFIERFSQMTPILQTLYATAFTWFVTALGAAVVFFFKEINKKVLDSMLGFAAGVMIAASFWSLLLPSIEMSREAGQAQWLPPLVGFLLGGAFLKLADSLMPHVHSRQKTEDAEGIKTSWKRSLLLFTAISLHNIPEGLAVGVAFGAAALGDSPAALPAALTLAFGIGLQNFPEGAAVSLPLRREGFFKI